MLLNWLLAPFSWETVHDTGAHRYQRNIVTGKRRVIRYVEGGHQPVNRQWLRTGRWSAAGLFPPRGL